MSGNVPATTAPAVPALPLRQATQKANEHASFAGMCEDRANGSAELTQFIVYFTGGASSTIALTTPEMKNCMKTCLQGLRDIHRQKALEFINMAAESDKF